MSSFHQNVPADAILCGSGEANAGMIVRVHSEQPLGAPSLCGDFTMLQGNDELMEMHLGDVISHNAFIGVRNALPQNGETSSFEHVRSAFVAAVGPDRMDVVNEHLFARQGWEHIGGFGSMLAGGAVKGAIRAFGVSMGQHLKKFQSAVDKGEKGAQDARTFKAKLGNDLDDIQTMIKKLEGFQKVIVDMKLAF